MGEENAPPKFLEPYVEEFTRVCTFIRQVLGSNLNALLSGSISILLDCIIELKANIETCSPESFYIHRLSPKQLFDNLVTFVTWCDSVYGNHQSIESQQPPQTLPNIDTTFNFETITNTGNLIKEYEKAKDNYIGLMHLQRVESEFYRLVQGISFAKEKSVKTADKNSPKISEAISNDSMDKNVNTNDYKSNQSLSSINSLLLTDNSIYDNGSQYFEPNRNNSLKELEKIGSLTTSKNLLCEPKYAPPLIKMTSSDFGDTGKMNAGNRDSQIFSSEDTECTSNNSMFDLNSEDSYYEKSSSLGYSSSSITLANNRNSNTPKQSLDNNHTQKIENTNNRKEKSKIRRPTPLNLSADKNYGEGYNEEKNSKFQNTSNTECPQKYVPPWVKKLIEPSNHVKNHQQFVPENYFLNAKKNCTQKRDFSKSDMNTSLLNFVQTPTLLEHSHKFSLHEYGGIKDKNEDDSLPKQSQKNTGKNFTKKNDVNHQSFHSNLREHRNNSSPTPSVSTLTEYSMLSDSENRSQSTYTYNHNEDNDEFNLQNFMRNKKHANHRLFMTSSPNPSKEEGGTFRKADNIENEKTEKNDRIKAKAKLVRKTVLEIKLPRGVQASQVLQELNRRLVDIEHTNTNNSNCKNGEKSDQNNSPNKKVVHSENDKIDFMEGDIIDSVILEQRDDYGENALISNIFTPENTTSRNPIAENCFSVLTPPSSPIPLNSLQAKNRIQANNIDQARYVISRPASNNNKNTDGQMQKVTPKINNTSSSEKCCKEKTCEENIKNMTALDCETENEIERLLSSMQSTVQELTDSQSCHLNHHKNNFTSHCQNTALANNLNNNKTLDDNISISTINTTFNNLFGNRDSDSSVFSIESGQIFTFDRASINSDNNKTTHFDQAGVTKKLGQQSNSFLANNINNHKKSFDQAIEPLNCNNNRSNNDIKNHQMNKDVIGYVKKVHETGRNYIKDTHSYYFKTIPTNGQAEPRKVDCKKKSETINNKDSSIIINNHPKISENVTNYVKTIGEYNGLAMDTDPFSFIKESTEYFIKDIEKYWKTLNIYTDLSENTIPFDNDKRNERFLSSTSNLNENNRQKLPKVSKLLPNITSNQTCLQNAIITEGNLFEHIIQDFTQLSSKPKPNTNNRNLAPQNQRPPQEEQIYDRIDVCNFKNARKNGSIFNNTNYSNNKIINIQSFQDRECRIFDAYHFKASSNKINLDNLPAAKISEPFTSNTTLYKLRRSDSAKETIEQQHPQNLSPHNRIDDNRSFHFTGRDAKIIYSDDTLVSRLNQKDSPTLQKPKLRLEGQERDIITLLKSPMIKAPSSLLKPSMIKPILKRQSSISTSSYETYNTSSTKTGTTHGDTLEKNVYNIKPPLPETVKTEYQTSLYDLVPKDIDLVFRDTQTQLNSSNEGNLNIADNCNSKSTLPYRSTLVNGKHRKFVQSGSIIAFIVYATCPMQNDFLFQEAFVLTYRLFMTPCVLLDLLIKRLSHFQRACVNGSTLFKRAYRSTFSFLYRILDDVSYNEITDATKYTIKNDGFTNSIGSDKLLLQSLKHQIQSMFEIGEIQLATILQGKLESKLMNNENGLIKSTTMYEKTEKMINFTPLSPALMSPKTQNNNINTGIPSPLTNSPYYMARKDTEPKFKFENDFTELFLNAKSRDIAEQLTFLDAQLFCRLSLNECLIWALKRNENLTPNLSTFTKHFNDVSYWCRTMILAPPIGIKRRKNSKDSQHNFNHINNLTNSFCNTTPNLTNIDDANNQITQEFISGLRLKVYRKFLKVMRHLRYEYFNFNALLALLSALDSSPISRLLEDNSHSKGTPSPCNSPCKKYCCPDKNKNQGVFDKRLNNNNLSQTFSYNNANKSDAPVDHKINYHRRLSDNLLSKNKSKMETSPFFASKQRKRSLSRGRRPKSPSSEILVMSPKSNLIARKSFGTPQNFMKGDNIPTNSSAIYNNSNAFINPTRNRDEKFSQTPAAPMLNLIKLTDKEMTLLQTLRELVDSSGSFKNYRKTLAEIVPPCIPYVGLILQDLTFIDVGNPTYTPDGLINFVKCWQLFSVLHSLKRFKNKTYKIKQDELIISIFDNFQYHLADDELWNISETIKPRRKIL